MQFQLGWRVADEVAVVFGIMTGVERPEALTDVAVDVLDLIASDIVSHYDYGRFHEGLAE